MKTIVNEIVAKNEEKKAAEGLGLLLRLVGNVIDKPIEEKFRTIKTTNAKISSTIMALDGGISDLLLALGFTKNDENYEFKGDEFKLLQWGRELITKEVEVLNMDPE